MFVCLYVHVHNIGSASSAIVWLHRLKHWRFFKGWGDWLKSIKFTWACSWCCTCMLVLWKLWMRAVMHSVHCTYKFRLPVWSGCPSVCTHHNIAMTISLKSTYILYSCAFCKAITIITIIEWEQDPLALQVYLENFQHWSLVSTNNIII